MRVLAAILITTWPCLAEPALSQPIRNIVNCAWTLGPANCLNALSAWRAEKSLINSDVTQLSEDLEQFPWKKYRNRSDEELHSQLCDETEKLLRRKSLSLTMIPGYRFELLSKGNGTLNIDVYKDADSAVSGRGKKKVKKTFYKILPLIIIPGLIMAAVIPFILPALKLLTLAAVVINNMAFTGAVFTLLRNNAFNDKYEHKVIYVNEGYKNEKHTHFVHGNEDFENYEESQNDYVIGEENGEHIEKQPPESGWIKQYEPSAHAGYFQVSGGQYKRNSQSARVSR